MKQYVDLILRILDEGSTKEDRTGVGTKSIFGHQSVYDLREGFPLLTTKKISWKNIVIENLWFLSGRTDIELLLKHNCHFWDPWADENGKVPSAYGNFWRHFPLPNGESNDQIAYVVDQLKTNPMSRRMGVSAWAPGNAQTSALPPCHAFWVVNTQMDENQSAYLCLHLTQRSCDIALGVPYNIAGYSLLLALFSRFSGIPAGIFAHTLIDAHIYTAKENGSMEEYDHVPGLQLQLQREPRELPTLEIDPSIQNLEDIEPLLELGTDEIMSRFVLHDYDPYPAINFKVAV